MDPQDFQMLVPPHLIAALYVAQALVGKADAEDAVQEAIIRAWQAWATIRERQAVRAWFLRIVVNVCYSWQSGRFGTHLRRNKPLDTLNLQQIPGRIDEYDPGGSAQLDRLDLRDAIDALADHLRQVIVLRYFAGLDASEIGEILGVPASTVRARIRRALALLRHSLQDMPDLDPSLKRNT